jgi:hypothetical protein
MALAADIRLRYKELKEVKEKYEDRDYNIARYVNPRRELIKDSQKFDDKGEERGKMAYSGVPNSALSVWADGMQGHMVSQSLRWFRSVLNDAELNKNDEIQRYLQLYDEAMYGEFNQSNFYSVLPEWFRDAGSIGTATLYTEEDLGRQMPVFTAIHPREIYISENRYGYVDTVFRDFFLSARQAVQIFGEDNLSSDIVENAKKHPEKQHEFIHGVFPNPDTMFGSILSKHKPIASVYIQKSKTGQGDEDGVARQSGFDTNPYAVWRLRKNSDEIYGYSPAADAMVEIKQLNQIEKTLITAAQMAVQPALNVPEHMRGHTRITPNGHNYYGSNGQVITPVNTGINFPVGIDREEKIQRIIEDKYRVEFFLILARAEREMTATEIMERQAEKSVLLGPQVDRLENEGLRKPFEMTADIAEKAGRLPDPPQILIDAKEEAKERGRNLNIAILFIGPLAQAQRRLYQMQPIKNGLNELAQASVIYPKVLKRVNPDKLAERILDASNFPQDIMFTDAEVAENEAKEKAELEQRQAMEQAGQMADAYPKVSKAPEAGSPAEQIGAAIG